MTQGTQDAPLTALRGAMLCYRNDPFRMPDSECLLYESDAVVVLQDGKIKQHGPAAEVLPTLPANLSVRNYDNCLILPGFIDCHVHYPQVEIIGSHGRQLMDWLNQYTFVAEQRYGDEAHARQAAKLFLQESLRCGTTTSAVFCTVDPMSVQVFFEESARLNMRNIAGKVLMDRNAPAPLLDTAQSGYDQTKALIERWHGKGRALYAVTPRFAVTSTPEQMELAGAVWQEHPGTYLQSHASENDDEIALVESLYPECKNYVDVYRRYGHLGERSILGHGIHLSEGEFQMLHESGTALAHCPTSNLFLGSGLFDFEQVLRPDRPIRVGLATDLGGGTSFSQLSSMQEAYKITQLRGHSLTVHQLFYLATLGAARALYLDDKIGSIDVDMEADLTVLDLAASPLLKYRLSQANSLEETLFALMILGDDRATAATYVAGELAYDRG